MKRDGRNKPSVLRVDMTGQRFGTLTVLDYAGYDPYTGHAFWHCKCDCGNVVAARGTSLRQGGIKSCGCHRVSLHSGTVPTAEPAVTSHEEEASNNAR